MPPRFNNRNNYHYKNNTGGASSSAPPREPPAALRISQALNSSHPCCYNPDDSKDFHKQYCRNNNAAKYNWFGPAGVTIIPFSRLVASCTATMTTFTTLDVSETNISSSASSPASTGVAYLLGFDSRIDKQYYSFCSGKLSDEFAIQHIRGCGIKAACRELSEEFKIHIYDPEANKKALLNDDESGEETNNAENELLPFIFTHWYSGNNVSFVFDLDAFLLHRFQKEKNSGASFTEFFNKYFKSVQQEMQSCFANDQLERDLRSIRDLRWLIFPSSGKSSDVPPFFAERGIERKIQLPSSSPSPLFIYDFAANELHRLTSNTSFASSSSSMQKFFSDERETTKGSQKNKRSPVSEKVDDDDDKQEEKEQVSMKLAVPKSKAVVLQQQADK